jgi:hypothetical protein
MDTTKAPPSEAYAEALAKFDPGQARDPAGTGTGGQWTSMRADAAVLSSPNAQSALAQHNASVGETPASYQSRLDAEDERILDEINAEIMAARKARKIKSDLIRMVVIAETQGVALDALRPRLQKVFGMDIVAETRRIRLEKISLEAAPTQALEKVHWYFLRTLTALVNRVYAGEMGDEFISQASALIASQINKAYKQAWLDVGDEGQPSPALKAQLTADAEALILKQYDWIDRYYNDIVRARDNDVPPNAVLARVRLWANRYNEAYTDAIMTIKAEVEERLQWQMGGMEEHCDICQQLNMIVARASEWQALGVQPQMGPNPALQPHDGLKGCGGWNCGCRLLPTTQRRTPKAFETIMNIVTAGYTPPEITIIPGIGKAESGDLKKHFGPGEHASGSPQSIHGGEGEHLPHEAQEHGGFSYQPASRKSPTKGKILSIYPDREKIFKPGTLTALAVRQFVKDNADLLADKGNYIGGWLDVDPPGSGQVFIDISRIVDTDDEALELSKKYKQAAYFDLGSKTVVQVGAHAAVGKAEKPEPKPPVLAILPPDFTDADLEAFIQALTKGKP